HYELREMSQNKVERIWTHKLLNIKYIFFILIYLIFIISLVLSTSINMGKMPFILSILYIIYYLVFKIEFRLALSFCLLMLLSLPVLLITNNYKIEIITIEPKTIIGIGDTVFKNKAICFEANIKKT
ncbi:unnamed protein product, partial [marine sediment metagenome]